MPRAAHLRPKSYLPIRPLYQDGVLGHLILRLGDELKLCSFYATQIIEVVILRSTSTLPYVNRGPPTTWKWQNPLLKIIPRRRDAMATFTSRHLCLASLEDIDSYLAKTNSHFTSDKSQLKVLSELLGLSIL